MAGQINRGSLFGDFLYNLSSRKDVNNIVEIGTWNGQGSTKCIMDALVLRYDNCKLYSLESNFDMFSQAKKYWDDLFIPYPMFKSKLELIHGRVIDLVDLFSLGDLKNENDYSPEWEIWLSQDISSIESCKNTLSLLPDKIDLLLLDGGEFSTLSEFNKLSFRSRIIACDDTRALKCREIRKILFDDKNFKCLVDNIEDRNGFCIFERI